MRIGLFTDQYTVGISGLVTSVTMLYEGLKKAGHTCFIFTSHTKKIKDDNPDVINLPGIPYPIKGLTDFRFSFRPEKYVDAIRACDLDIIHVHSEFFLAKVAITAAGQLDLPLVYTMHTMWEHYLGYLSRFIDSLMHERFWRSMKKMWLKPLTEKADVIIVPSEKIYRQKDRYGFGDNVTVIPTGIDLDRFAPAEENRRTAERLTEDLGIKGKTVFFYLGRVAAEKEIRTSIRAFAALRNTENTVFVIVGEGPALAELKKLADDLQLSGRVIFPGSVPWTETPAWYQVGDVFISSSMTETQGLTFVEALASGMPMIALRDETLTSLIHNGENGFLCDSPESMTERMEEVACDPELLARISGHVVPEVYEYSKEAYAAKIFAVYEGVLEKR